MEAGLHVYQYRDRAPGRRRLRRRVLQPRHCRSLRPPQRRRSAQSQGRSGCSAAGHASWPIYFGSLSHLDPLLDLQPGLHGSVESLPSSSSDWSRSCSEERCESWMRASELLCVAAPPLSAFASREFGASSWKGHWRSLCGLSQCGQAVSSIVMSSDGCFQ